MFIDLILEHGVPYRVHGDRGGENRDISILMILLRGLKGVRFMWGPWCSIPKLSIFGLRLGSDLYIGGVHSSSG